MITFLKNTEVELEFIIDDVDIAFANALRRVVLSEIPNVAPDVIKVHANTSSMHNEFLSKRISLIPLCFEESEVDGFNKSKYKFVINKQGETSNNVTTNDIRIFDENEVAYDAAFTSKIFPVDPITKDPILIAWLKQGETMHLEFNAQKNVSLNHHTKFCPVSTCTYFNTLDEKLVKEHRRGIQGDANLNKFDTLDKYRLFKKNEYGEACSFTFKVVSECRLTPFYLVKKAFEVLKGKLMSLESKTLVETIHDESRFYALTVKDEDHTIGNLMQVSVYNNYVRKDRIIDFAGYFQPHPLDRIIIFKIRFLEGKDDVKRFWGEAIRITCAALENLEKLWQKPKKITRR